MKCYYCGKTGHTQDKCYSKRNSQNGKNNAQERVYDSPTKRVYDNRERVNENSNNNNQNVHQSLASRHHEGRGDNLN